MKRLYLWNRRTRRTLIIITCIMIMSAVVIVLAFLTRWLMSILEISPFRTPSYDLAVFILLWLLIVLHSANLWAGELLGLLEALFSPPKPPVLPDGNLPANPPAQSVTTVTLRYINFKYRCTACGYITDKPGSCPHDHLELKEYDPVEDSSRLDL